MSKFACKSKPSSARHIDQKRSKDKRHYLATSLKAFSAFSARSRSTSTSLRSILIYSIAISTVLALLFPAAAAAAAAAAAVVVEGALCGSSPPLPPLLGSLAFEVPLGFGVVGLRIPAGGSRASISLRALLIRFLRPCSAILWDVRFDVRLVERASG